MVGVDLANPGADVPLQISISGRSRVLTIGCYRQYSRSGLGPECRLER